MLQSQCPLCPARSDGICAVANDATRARLAGLARPLRAAAGDAVALQGDEVTHWTVLRSGTVKLCRTTADGREQVMGFALPGDVIGIGARIHPATAEAASAVTACRFPREAMESLLADEPALARRVLAVAGDGMARAQDHLLRLGSMTAMERIASLVLELSGRGGDAGGALPDGVTQMDIAACLGLTAETVSRSIAKLRSTGAVASGRRIAVRDAAALTELACA